MLKVSTDEAIDLIQVRTGLCVLNIELSHRKSSFTHKLSRSTNSVINGLSVLKLCAVLYIFFFFFSLILLFCFIVLCLCLAAILANKDLNTSKN